MARQVQGHRIAFRLRIDGIELFQGLNGGKIDLTYDNGRLTQATASAKSLSVSGSVGTLRATNAAVDLQLNPDGSVKSLLAQGDRATLTGTSGTFDVTKGSLALTYGPGGAVQQ